MADDFQVKQSSSSSGAYGLGGAVVGGVGAGWAANHFTKPKYGSYEELIAEKQDSFDKKIQAAEGEDKKFLEEAKKVAGKRADAEADFDKQFNEWKEKNPSTAKAETDDYKKLVQEEKDAETKLTNKKNELIDAKVKSIKANAGTEKVEKLSIEEALNRKAKQIAELTKWYETQKAKGADSEKLKSITAKVTAAEKEAEELAAKLAEKIDYGKLKDEALDNKKKEVANAYKLAIKDRVAQKLKRFDAPLVSEDAKLLNDFKANQAQMKELEASFQRELKELGKIIDKDLSVNWKDSHSLELMNNRANAVGKKQKQYVDALTKLQEAYNKVAENKSASGEFNWSTFFENLKKLGTGEGLEGSVQDVKTQLEKYLKENKTLDANEQKAIKRLINGEINEASIKEALDAAKEKQNTIINQINKLNQIVDKGVIGEEETGRIKQAMKERGVYVKNGELIEKATGNKVKQAPNPAETPAKAKLPKGVNVPKDVKIDYTTKTAANLTDDEIKKQAEAAIKESDYKAEADALKKAKEAREAAYKNLKDGEKLTNKQLQEAFCKEKGYESKAKFTEKAVKDAESTFKKDFKQWLERRHGFEGATGWKIAGVAAAGALILGGIASALAPKNKA